jgi:hypothetical protein
MATRQVIHALLAAAFMALVASPALACKGEETLLSGFSSPGWVMEPQNSIDIADGTASTSSKFAGLFYEGGFFPEADVCVDVMFPEEREPSDAGFYLFAGDNQYLLFVLADGRVALVIVTPEGDLRPVPLHPAEGFRVGEANTLRVVWGAEPHGQLFINDQLAFEFPFLQKGRKIGIMAHSQGGNIEFSNLSVTK